MATRLGGFEWIYCTKDGEVILPYSNPEQFLTSIDSKLKGGEIGLLMAINELSSLYNIVSHAVQNGRAVYDLAGNRLKKANVSDYYRLAENMLKYYAPKDIQVE